MAASPSEHSGHLPPLELAMTAEALHAQFAAEDETAAHRLLGALCDAYLQKKLRLGA